MKKLIAVILSFVCTASFAQNGLFLQPEVGGGFGNADIAPSRNSYVTHYNTQNIFSYQGQMNIGYNAGKWQFITGVGYLRTG